MLNNEYGIKKYEDVLFNFLDSKNRKILLTSVMVVNTNPKNGLFKLKKPYKNNSLAK